MNTQEPIEMDYHELHDYNEEFEWVELDCPDCGTQGLKRFTESQGPDDYRFYDVCPRCHTKFEE